jgi:outer membrane protein assembly factor BamB
LKRPDWTKTSWLIPGIVGVLALAALVTWFTRGLGKPLELRTPGRDRGPGSEAGGGTNPVYAGKLVRGDEQPANLPGAWPCFRGTNSDGISREPSPLLRSWQTGEPRELWGIEVGEGYAGPAVLNGRVYLMDYDREKRQDALRCLSLADGREIWRFAYSVSVKRNHGMSRTVPSVTDKLAIAMGPKCQVVCVDSISGELRWGMDLVREYGTTVPQWYAGQCPLIDKADVVLAPGGKNVLLLAAEAETGKVLWQTPNPRGWKMTHASVVPMDVEGERVYVYCADKGVVGVSAATGKLLWETTDWKISIATVPSPLVLDGGRIFFSGGYKAGSMMMQLRKEGNQIVPKVLFRLPEEVFGATQHTPIYHDGYIYGVRPDGKFVCLTAEGRISWASDGPLFGLGPFMLAGDLFFSVNDSGLLRLIEATPQKYTLLGQAQILKNRDSWGPLALAGGRLLARDLTRLVCLDAAKR